MPLYISENITAEDYDSLFVIQYKAFSYEEQVLQFFSGGLDPSVRARNVAAFVKQRGFGNVKAAKVVDDETGQICAFATMREYDGPPFASTEKSDVRYPDVNDDVRPFLEWFVNAKNDRRRKMEALQVPGPYGYLSNLATDPSRQRQGAARLLMKWVVDKLDSVGARGALQASPVASQYGLYEKYGFRSVDVHTYVDAARFPNAKPITLTTMVRDGISQ